MGKNDGHVGKIDGNIVQIDRVAVLQADPATAARRPLTDRGLLQSIPCRGERYHEMTAGENIKYMISTQEEQLTQTLYDATKFEIATYAAKRELMSAEVPARDETSATLSVLDIERRSHELLVQSFHLFDESQMVIKTQAIIEVIKG